MLPFLFQNQKKDSNIKMNINFLDSHSFNPYTAELLQQYLIQHHLPSTGFYYVLAIQDHTILALGILYQKKLHPHRDYILLHSLQDCLEPRLFSTLIQHLEHNSKQGKLQYLLNSKDMHLNQLFRFHDFKIARRTFLIELNQLQLASLNPEPIKTKNLKQLSLHEWRELKTLFHTHYRQHHASVNGLAKEVCSEQLFKLLENINLEQSKVSLNCQPNHHKCAPSIMAYLLIGNSDPCTLEVAYIGGREESHFNEYLPFFQLELSSLLQQFQRVYFEADDTDYYAYTLAHRLGCDFAKNDYTLIKDLKNRINSDF